MTTLDYDYDIASRLAGEDRDSILVGYGYDDKNQLTADGAGAYSYDAAGNRDSHQTGPGNRLQSDGTWTYTHDDEGNLVKKVCIADGLTWTFGYDHRNQLVWAERRTTDGGALELRLDYAYDVFARRLEESRWAQAGGTTVTRFGYDGQDVLADLNGANVLQVRYVRPDGIDALGARASASGLVAWYFTDLRGSVIALTDGAGVLRTEIAYDGFGNIVSDTDPGFGDRHKYTGREWQEDLGWNYHRRRWYDPATGQWVTEDPIRITAGDYNYYRYVKNGPTNSVDPEGLQGKPPIPWDDIIPNPQDFYEEGLEKIEEQAKKKTGLIGVRRRIAIAINDSEKRKSEGSLVLEDLSLVTQGLGIDVSTDEADARFLRTLRRRGFIATLTTVATVTWRIAEGQKPPPRSERVVVEVHVKKLIVAMDARGRIGTREHTILRKSGEIDLPQVSTARLFRGNAAMDIQSLYEKAFFP